MQIYNYCPTTGEFINTADAHLDPLETKNKGKDVYLLPANATFDAPPETGANEVALFVAGVWLVSADYRGQIFYDTATGEHREITEVGVEPDPGWTDRCPGADETWNAESGRWEPDLAAIKAVKCTEINSARAIAINAGVEWNGYTWDSDEISRNNLTGTVAGVQAGILTPDSEGYIIKWRTKDNQDVNLTQTDVLELSAAMLSHVNACYQKSWGLKNQIEAASTIAEIEQIAC